MGVSEYLFIALFFGIPGVAGAVMARRREKNVLLWGVASALFPFCVFILWFQRPDHEIPGAFRQCRSCGQIYPWKLVACRYCGASSQP